MEVGVTENLKVWIPVLGGPVLLLVVLAVLNAPPGVADVAKQWCADVAKIALGVWLGMSLALLTLPTKGSGPKSSEVN